MMDKQHLIDSILGIHETVSRLSLACSMGNWMRLDLTINQLKTLILIPYHGKVSFKGLAIALRITPANITGIADRLIQNGLVIRRHDPDDCLIQYLMLTEKAQMMLNNIKKIIVTEETKILSSLDIEDLAAMEKDYPLL
jgi:MarR family transcriptional regulator, organic hydroperoxide resistance regulator